MKKTIFLNGKFLGQSITGVQRTAHEIISALDDLIEEEKIDSSLYEFVLIHPKLKHQYSYKHIKLQQRGFMTGNLWEQFELPIYTFNRLLISMCMISCLFKRKQIVVVHDASVYVNPDFFSKAFRSWYRVAIFILGKFSKSIVTVSNFSKKQLIKYAGISSYKINVIYNAADHILKFNKPDKGFVEKIAHLKPYVLAVSSLGKNKNFDGLSRAFLNSKNHSYNVLIAGGISSSLQISTVDKAITYCGYVSNEELKYLYENASLFVFPSFYEGFGIPPIEAMLLGCPVLASNTSAMPEILGDSCEYMDPHDNEDMTLQLDKILDSIELQNTLKEKGMLKALAYSWHKSAMELYYIIERTN